MKQMDVYELELRHRSLDAQIHKLDRRGAHMTPHEQERAAELKRQRLEMKDRLYAMRLRWTGVNG